MCCNYKTTKFERLGMKKNQYWMNMTEVDINYLTFYMDDIVKC